MMAKRRPDFFLEGIDWFDIVAALGGIPIDATASRWANARRTMVSVVIYAVLRCRRQGQLVRDEYVVRGILDEEGKSQRFIGIFRRSSGYFPARLVGTPVSAQKAGSK